MSSKGYDFNDITGKVIGAALEVHKQLGPGFREVIYQRALEKELFAAELDFAREETIDIFYKGDKIGERRVDFVVGDCMVELKAKQILEEVDYIQALSYLRATAYKVGLLLNFGAKKLEIKRLVNSNPTYNPDSHRSL